MYFKSIEKFTMRDDTGKGYFPTPDFLPITWKEFKTSEKSLFVQISLIENVQPWVLLKVSKM
jgi:hypothetical protein